MNVLVREALELVNRTQAALDRMRALAVAIELVIESDAHHGNAMSLAAVIEETADELSDGVRHWYEDIRRRHIQDQAKEATQGTLDLGDEHQPW